MNMNERERLLCYSSGIVGSILSNPNNTFTSQQLIRPAIRSASKMIATIYDDKLLAEILSEPGL